MDWEYKSKYSYGRMISIARRNINNFPNEIRIKYENNLYFNNDNNNNSNINNINNNFLTYMENDLNLTVENIYINNINISYKNYKFNLIEKYKYIPGIIFIHNNNNNNDDFDSECFTGGETSNIYSHIYTFKNRLDGKINNIYKNKNGNIYNCLEIIRNKYNKEIIETIYAVINNSKF